MSTRLTHSRNYAFQVLLLDEWHRCGVDLVFLNLSLGQSPEDDLLLQVQGIVAEYERAKIMERSRRGKKHAAQSGSLNVMSNAPFGYRYISVREGGGHARFEPVAEQARIVQQIFSWIGRNRCSLAEVCRRLQKAGEVTATGKRIWSRQAVWHILQNPAYQGRAAYGKTHMMPRGKKARPRSARGRPAKPRRSNAPVAADPKDWVFVPVPALVDVALFRATQEQLQENRGAAEFATRRFKNRSDNQACRPRYIVLFYVPADDDQQLLIAVIFSLNSSGVIGMEAILSDCRSHLRDDQNPTHIRFSNFPVRAHVTLKPSFHTVVSDVVLIWTGRPISRAQRTACSVHRQSRRILGRFRELECKSDCCQPASDDRSSSVCGCSCAKMEGI
jgi:DNA invertase Pin-like site-specific DNA recombinase